MHGSTTPEHIYTLADTSQFEGLFNGPFFKGYREPRIAMVGRSNVGKSSLINFLLKKKLAYTSNTPGKTAAIHFYTWPEGNKILTDLPGYGFARVAKTEHHKWEKLIERYLHSDPGLELALVLLDARHGPTPIDLEAIQFLRTKNVPLHLIFTKVDTLKKQSERSQRQKEAKQALARLGFGASNVSWVSTESRVGLKELTSFLTQERLESSSQDEIEVKNE